MNDHALVIDVQGLNKSFAGHKAVVDLALQVRRGEIFGSLSDDVKAQASAAA